MDQDLSELFSGFSKLQRRERLQRLLSSGLLTADDILFLREGASIDPKLADHFIENAIGYFQMPLGVATNFNIDGRDYLIPMAVEETSIVAAASKTAKWVRENGHIETRSIGRDIIGQIQMARVEDPLKVKAIIEKNRDELLNQANVVASGLVRRGGGARDIRVRILERDGDAHLDENFSVTDTLAGDGRPKMVVVHIYVDPCDAMGANIINQICEALKSPIQEMTGEKVTMCILSNLVDSKLTESRVTIENISAELGEGIEEASLFAQRDPYRAATNNKGVLNGIDAVLIATGNDWRAVEAGMHAFAVKNGRYSSLTHWEMKGRDLVGTLQAPVIVGTVGGVTTLHPMAQMGLRMMAIDSAEHLSRVVASVGIVQNLGALRALSTVGVVEGHMKLHAANLALAAGANREEISSVQRQLEDILKIQKRVSLSQAVEVLDRVRQGLRGVVVSPTSSPK